MKQYPGPWERKPLQEKVLLGYNPLEKCIFCSHPVTDGNSVSNVKYTFKGTKYIDGIEYMIVSNRADTNIYIYVNEYLNTNQCTCIHPKKILSPIGTLFSLYKPFTIAPRPERQIYTFQPVFPTLSPYSICIDRIIQGIDKRTTCMIKNIPNKLSTAQLLSVLTSICYNSFNFVYLRMDFKRNCNNGYAFINFREPKYIPIFLDALQGKRWKSFKSEKKAEIAYARIQGLPMLHCRFKRSDILASNQEYWPIVYNEAGDQIPANEWKQKPLK
ncbi:hypothetical protein NEOKW01_0434 [Nematocida sp. AWRm80]|nr:hypothetical protein NEOKW01_0434 [Nematocida sp. AWRm80]